MSSLSHFRGVVGIFLAGWLVGLSVPAHALSCIGVSDRFFVNCSTNHCQVAFRARDVPAPGGCARRTVVEPVPPDATAVLLKRLSSEVSSGEYEVTLVHRYYGEPPVTAEELERAFGAQGLRTPRVTVRQLAAGTNLEALRDEWQSHANRTMVELVAYWTIELVLLATGLFGLYRTTVEYRRRLRQLVSGSVAGPIALQFVLFVLAVFCLGSPTWPVLVGLVAPVVMVVWVYELAVYLLSRYRRTTANES